MVTFGFSIIEIIGVLVIPVLLPILVGLVTKTVTSGGTKAILLATLTLVNQILVQGVEAIKGTGTFDVGKALVLLAPAFAISVASHYGLWKPTGVSEKAQEVGTV